MIRVLYDEHLIAKRIAELGREIRAVYKEEGPLHVIVLLNGAMIFAADLLRSIDLPDIQYDTLSVSSYSGCHSTGKIQFRSSMKVDAAGQNILLVDDILDTGFSLKKTSEYLYSAGAAKIRTCVLLDKRLSDESQKQFKADWTGFSVDNVFLIGYGLDYDEKYRCLPFIGCLEENRDEVK